MNNVFRRAVVFSCALAMVIQAVAQDSANATFTDGPYTATISYTETNGLRTYDLASDAPLRENRPPEKRVTFTESPDHAVVRSGNAMFDGLYALAVHEALQNSVSQIKDGAYGYGDPVQLKAFQTGEFWTYVWTRDLAYSLKLALAGFDPDRAAQSLLFKSSTVKDSVTADFPHQIIQDTGSGGSYPVSSDRVVWALGAAETLKYLDNPARSNFLHQVYPILHDTIEQDRVLVFDADDGLYRGEQSFLDWREQTYPAWTRTNVTAIAMSKALSVNVLDYALLQIAADEARQLNKRDDANKYTRWAQDLQGAINDRFYDPVHGVYSTYFLSDGGPGVVAHRYDLLGESLAILLGVADQSQAETIIQRYPVGPYGPPVVWPEEDSVPIYHNQAIWPFVTAYWVKAARQADEPAAVNGGIRSLMRGAALNLSNMENFDYVTGLAEVKGQKINGPVINSRRQLWSVAGYLSMVQDVVFGLDTTLDSIRFQPYVTARMRNELFASNSVVELKNFPYRGRIISVTLHLPPMSAETNGVCQVSRIELNQQAVTNDFVAAYKLLKGKTNQWDIYLEPPGARIISPVLMSTDPLARGDSIYAPASPGWADAEPGAITVEGGKLRLHPQKPDGAEVSLRNYRDGQILSFDDFAEAIDPASPDYTNTAHFYMFEVVDPKTGLASQLSPSRTYTTAQSRQMIPATAMVNHGGHLAQDRFFMNWGARGDTLEVTNFSVPQEGHYQVRALFSNGSGPVNTGITCAVKRLEISTNGQVMASGYLVMPQSGDWERYDLSSTIGADLKAGQAYSVRIFEDGRCLNMSWLAQNSRYTAHPGGGDESYGYVNIAGLELTRVGAYPR